MTTNEFDYLSDEICSEFDRLGLGTQDNPFSGLTAETIDPQVVQIYDDYESGIYLAEPLLSHLKSLQTATLEDIWQEIRQFQVG